MIKRNLYGLLIVLSYIVLYWLCIVVWSFSRFSGIGRFAATLDIGLRAVAIPFLIGGIIAFVFKRRLEILALGISPFLSSAAMLVVTDANWHEMKHGVLGFWTVGVTAACASVAGAMFERRAQLPK